MLHGTEKSVRALRAQSECKNAQAVTPGHRFVQNLRNPIRDGKVPGFLARETYNAMKTSVRVLALLAAGLMLFSTTGCTKLRARDQLNKGVLAYKNAKYEEAINHFQQAVELDPTLLNARLYLATAFAQQYIPGADAPDNNKFAEQAIDQYKEVLQRDPKNVNSVKGIAYLFLQMKKFNDAKDYYRKATDLDPNDPEPYYSVAVIDWTQTYQPRMEERAKLGLKPEEPLKDKKVCAAPEGKEHAEHSGRHRQSEQGAATASGLRRRDGLHEPDVPRTRRCSVRRSKRASSRSENRRRVGR